MRDQLKYPIAYNAGRRGFYYDGPLESLPLLRITDGELLALAIAKETLYPHQGTAYGSALATAFDKITATLSSQLQLNHGDLAGLFSYRDSGVAPVDSELFTRLGESILGHQQIRFTYHRSNHDDHFEVRVDPYHLASINGQWYLVARSHHTEAIRTYALSRIQELELTPHRFEKPTDFSAADYFADSLGPFRGEIVTKIRIAFAPYAAGLVRERIWHRSQKITTKRDGSLILEIKINDTYEALRWILSWGDQAQLLSPRGLVQEMRQHAVRLSEIYGSS